jgi:hypothetical protein
MHGICKPFQSKFSCATFQNLQLLLVLCHCFLAHGDVVVGIAIFHIKLSTPRLGSFICSSLILHESWSDHFNLILKEKKKGTPPWYVNVGGHPMESISHGLRKEKRWGGVPKLYKRAPMCQIFKELGTSLTCLLWKIVRPHC